MRLGAVLRVVGALLIVISTFMFWPLLWSILYRQPDRDAFIGSIVIGYATGYALMLYPKEEVELRSREAFAVVVLGWFFSALLGALPFHFCGYSLTDAFFESMSGFTTTGASIMTDIESNPKGLLFWRSLTHWLGGMGIIVLSLAILPFLGAGGMELYKAEVPGPVAEKLTPRIRQTAMLLWGVYVILSAAECLLLWAGGMNLYEALTHTFGTMATGGFSPLNKSIGQYGNAYFDWVITLFMFLAGCNFTLHYRAIFQRDLKAYVEDHEFRFFLGVVVFSSLSIAISLLVHHVYPSPVEAIRYSAFQVVSILTTTGYVTADFEGWPDYAQVLLLLLMFVGGCAGSTGGGIKGIRILLLAKRAHMELQKLLHPKAVMSTRLGRSVVDERIVNAVMVFFFMYLLVFSLATLAMAALGMDVLSAIASVAATLNNIGPGLGSVGPMDNYAHVPALGKWILSSCMLMGRLELYACLVLLLPSTWEK